MKPGLLGLFTILMLLAGTARAEPVCYVANNNNSHIAFHFRIEDSKFTGYFADFSARYCWQGEAPETGNINVSVNMTSVKTGNSDLDTGMQEQDALDTADFPTAHWVTQSISKHGDNYQVQGKLTIHGISKQQNGSFQLKRQNHGWQLTGSSTLNRMDYQLGTGQYNDTSFIPAEVKVEFDLELTHSE